MKGIYLDNSTTARPSPRSVSAMLPFLSDLWGAPSSPHSFGNTLMPHIERSYQAIYQFLGASENETFILTSSGAEAVNQVFHSVYHEYSRKQAKNHYIVCESDEAPALMCVSKLVEYGCVGSLLPLNSNGVISPQTLEETITASTALVSLSWGNGLTGTLQPAKEIGEVCKKKGVLLHLDITHALGKSYFDLETLKADYITFNGEQFHSPRGCGGVLFRKGIPTFPLIVGGIEQAALHAGNLNVALLTALAEACNEAKDSRDYLCTEISRLRNKLENDLKAKVPNSSILFKDTNRLPHISVIAFPGIVNETLLYLLSKRKIFACIGGGSFQQLSFVLEACGVESSLAHSCISFSLSREITDDEIDEVVENISDAIKKYTKVIPKMEKYES